MFMKATARITYGDSRTKSKGSQLYWLEKFMKECDSIQQVQPLLGNQYHRADMLTRRCNFEDWKDHVEDRHRHTRVQTQKGGDTNSYNKNTH
eukprot:13831310-Heterocapsa_arctica.AAC.1